MADGVVNINDGAVTSNKIADGAVTASKILNGSVGTSNLADGSITTSKIGDSQVTTTKIADGAITVGKLGFSIDNNPDDTTVYLKSFLDAGQNVEQAFTSANAAILAAITTSPYNSNRVGRIRLKLPAGRFLITTTNIFLQNPSVRTSGLVIEGAGVNATEIVFQPTLANQSFIFNNDKWLFLTLRDMTFIGDSVNASNLTFMDSFSTGGAQNYVFERVNWEGSWKYGFHLTGDNTNSETSFYHCGINGSWDTFFWSETSDQFLNYNFYSCQFEVDEGNFIKLTKGGNVNVWGGSFIHTGTNGGTFFIMEGNTHSYGVQRFLCAGVRFEHRVENSKLIDCSWAAGTVKFISIDNTSATGERSASWKFAKFSPSNNSMPVISFDGCVLMGKIEFVYSSNTFDHPHNVEFSNCEFSRYAKASDIVVYTGSTNPGGKPVVKFRNCHYQSASATQAVFDANIGYEVSNRALLTQNILSIKNAGGQFPALGDYEDFDLPINAIITRIVLYSPAGAVSSGAAANFKVQTREATPQVLASVNVTPYSGGFNVDAALFHQCSTDAKRQLRLLSGSVVDQYNSKALCLIHYLA